ncbi:FapA family protein [Oceanobacillus massiliensis]|uniref:FapA family protein n=1 Tax=Oceanobacillus massiliensis TaxID=1465765 RepID=UPI003019147E
MENIVSRGRNIEEAIQLGLKIMEAAKQDVNVEIIQQDVKGFMGIGKKQAIVKLSLVKSQPTNQPTFHYASSSTEDLVESLLQRESKKTADKQSETKQTGIPAADAEEGTVYVKDGQITVKDSPAGYSTVTIGKGIQLIKNNEVVTEKSTVLSEKDSIKIKLEDAIVTDTKWSLSFEDEKLRALLKIDPGCRISYKLKDVTPNRHIEIESEELKEIKNTLTYDDVIKKMEALQITYGINHDEIMTAIQTSEPGEFEIAAGRKTESGKDGWLEIKVDVNPHNGLIADERGKVDFRETNLIPTVEKGAIIGVIHPPIPGRSGITVKSETLPAKQSHPLKLILKDLVEVDDRLVATEAGRPSIEQRGNLVKAAIIPKLVHRSNVDLSSGNIRFNGDIEIVGEVEENMSVEAGGDIFVHKSAAMANLISSKSITIKGNVVSSELSAGKNSMLIVELGQLLGMMHEQLNKMIALIKQLQQSPAFKSSDFAITGLQPLITILLEKRFQNFLSYAKQYQEVAEKGKDYLDSDEWYHVAISIRQIFLTISNQITTMERLVQLSEKMKELEEFSEVPVEPNSYITLSDTINSSLYCSGDISIIGKGCINTKVHAGGHLKVTGILRGGEVFGRLGATINEVGSHSGTKAVISVPIDQQIKITRAFEGTVLKIGNKIMALKEEKKNFTARINSNDEIIFEGI